VKLRALQIVSFCFLLMGAGYLIESLRLPMGTSGRPGSGFYPFLVGIALVGLSLALSVQSLTQKELPGEKAEAFPKGQDLGRVVAVSSSLIFFAVFFKPLGYGICSVALMMAVLRLLGLRSWAKTAMISILTMGISYYLFASILGVPLPQGALFS
jgi:hypothetical protein